MGLRIGLLGSSALQNDGPITPIILQCRTPQETNPEGRWGVKLLFDKILVVAVVVVASWLLNLG